jgi:hypothetical protein
VLTLCSLPYSAKQAHYNLHGFLASAFLAAPATESQSSFSRSKGHWTEPERAHGYKRTHLDQWRELSKIGNQTTDRHVLPEQATIDKIYKGRGELEEIEMSWPTL